ncbi:hypothetical protein HYY70_05960 [Candidatus Woesearchaeota archaeon]|nr:hypothetical protein [Candidatus Woesearchaeota archaeon]
MIGSRGNKGRIEEKTQVIYDMIEEILKEIKSGEIDHKLLIRRLEYIKKISHSITLLGEDIREVISDKIDNLDKELVKLI